MRSPCARAGYSAGSFCLDLFLGRARAFRNVPRCEAPRTILAITGDIKRHMITVDEYGNIVERKI